MLQNILLITISFMLSCLLTGWLSRRLLKSGLMDIPCERSSHTIPTPRGGGIAIMAILMVGFAVFWLLGKGLIDNSFYLALMLIIGISWLDDKFNLTPGLRLLIHILATALVLLKQGCFEVLPLPEPLNFQLGWLGYPLSFIWILGVMNIFNFLDGIDGYAGVQTIVVGCGLWFYYSGMEANLIGLLLIGTSAGFLVYNWQPAKIFMGDIGSVALGFCFAVLPFYLGERLIEENVIIIALLLWFFLADGTFTILRRIFNTEKIWKPHRSHIYQRLTIVGWTHGKIVLFVLSLQSLLFICVGLWINGLISNPWWVICIALFLFIVMITITIKQEQKTTVKV